MTGALFGFVELQAAKDAERWVIFSSIGGTGLA
jgi:hypothetical protein